MKIKHLFTLIMLASTLSVLGSAPKEGANPDQAIRKSSNIDERTIIAYSPDGQSFTVTDYGRRMQYLYRINADGSNTLAHQRSFAESDEAFRQALSDLQN